MDERVSNGRPAQVLVVVAILTAVVVAVTGVQLVVGLVRDRHWWLASAAGAVISACVAVGWLAVRALRWTLRR